MQIDKRTVDRAVRRGRPAPPRACVPRDTAETPLRRPGDAPPDGASSPRRPTGAGAADRRLAWSRRSAASCRPPGAGEPEVSRRRRAGQFVAGLELAAVEVYRAASGHREADQRRRTRSPRCSSGHHQDHADALNGIIGEDAAVTEPNAGAGRRVRPDGPRPPPDEAAHPGGRLLTSRRRPPSTYLMAIGTLEDAAERQATGHHPPRRVPARRRCSPRAGQASRPST